MSRSGGMAERAFVFIGAPSLLVLRLRRPPERQQAVQMRQPTLPSTVWPRQKTLGFSEVRGGTDETALW